MRGRAAGASLLVLTLIGPIKPADAQTGVREVAATERGVIVVARRPGPC